MPNDETTVTTTFDGEIHCDSSKSPRFHTCAPKGGMFKFGSGGAVGGKVAGGKGLSVGRS